MVETADVAPRPEDAEIDGARSITRAAVAPESAAAEGKKDNAAHRLAEMRRDPEAIRRAFETSQFPYESRLTEREYLTRVLSLIHI